MSQAKADEVLYSLSGAVRHCERCKADKLFTWTGEEMCDGFQLGNERGSVVWQLAECETCGGSYCILSHWDNG